MSVAHLPRPCILAALFAALLISSSLLAQDSRSLFSLSANNGVIGVEPWPSVPFPGGVRLWDTNTSWDDINVADGVYDWTTLDNWLAHTAANHAQALYTFGYIAPWASSNPTDPMCKPTPGTCDPPNDLNADGSGTDQHWKDFVTALAIHNQNSATGHIKFWEMWNEPHNAFFWNGTYAQLIRMVSDAYAILKSYDPHAVILSPAFGWSEKYYLDYMSGYLAAGGGKYADVMSVHGYVLGPYHKYRDPENVNPDCAAYRAVLRKYGLAGKEIWDTEADWGKNLNFSNPDLQAAWVSRFYLMHASNRIRRMYWFLWNGGDQGGLWQPDPQNHREGTLLEGGVAYQSLAGWMIGAKMINGCTSVGTIYSCEFTRSGGYQALAVWDTADSCSNGECETTQYHYNGNYVNYLDLAGSQHQVNQNWVPIGAKPILLQNQ